MSAELLIGTGVVVVGLVVMLIRATRRYRKLKYEMDSLDAMAGWVLDHQDRE